MLLAHFVDAGSVIRIFIKLKSKEYERLYVYEISTIYIKVYVVK